MCQVVNSGPQIKRRHFILTVMDSVIFNNKKQVKQVAVSKQEAKLSLG